jgi:uncharacterized phosphosugar-binding protein
MGERKTMTSVPYFAALKEILARIESEQINHIREAGALIGSLIAKGGVVHTFGAGHSHMIAEEAFFRAGGLAAVNAILDPRLLFLDGALASTHAERETGYAKLLLDREDIQPGDAAIIISNSGRNAVPVEMAQEMRAKDVKIVAITNLEQSSRSLSRHVSGKRLFELADIVIDNCIPEGDAVLEIPNRAQRIGPSSTIAGAAIVNAVMIEAASHLHKADLPIPLFASVNLPSTSDESLEAILARWAPRVRLFRTEDHGSAGSKSK